MNKLRELREAQHISQAKLSKLLNMNRPLICMYENGERSISKNDTVKLCKFFHVSSSYLIGENLSQVIEDFVNRYYSIYCDNDLTDDQLGNDKQGALILEVMNELLDLSKDELQELLNTLKNDSISKQITDISKE